MSRIIHTESPAQLRNRHRRSIAEMLRRLSQKQDIDAEAKDMAAMIALLLREIYESVEKSARAWEKRDYWMKAERLLRDWEWTAELAANMDDVLRHDAFDLLPELMADLLPRFADIQLKKMMRKPDLWRGAYDRLQAAPPPPSPW